MTRLQRPRRISTFLINTNTKIHIPKHTKTYMHTKKTIFMFMCAVAQKAITLGFMVYSAQYKNI